MAPVQRPPKVTSEQQRLPLHVSSPKVGLPLIFRLLGDSLWVPTHYFQGQTVPCDYEGQCAYHSAPLIWKGYAPAYLYSQGANRWIATVAEFTRWAFEQLPKDSLRGYTLELKRASKRRNARVEVVWSRRDGEVGLGHPFDVIPCLRVLWGVSRFLTYEAPGDEGEAVAPDVPDQPPPQRPGRGARSEERAAPELVRAGVAQLLAGLESGTEEARVPNRREKAPRRPAPPQAPQAPAPLAPTIPINGHPLQKKKA